MVVAAPLKSGGAFYSTQIQVIRTKTRYKMADVRREGERRRSDRAHRSPSRSRSRSPRNRRFGSRSPRRNSPPRPGPGKQREREVKPEDKLVPQHTQVKIDRGKVRYVIAVT